MTIFDNLYPLGLGTNRLPIKSAKDEEGIERSSQIIVDAIKSGVNFVDISHTYSRGMAQRAFRQAVRQVGEFDGVTIKTRIEMDIDVDSVRKRAEDSLTNMGISHAKYFYFWSLFSYAEFEKIMRPNGLYEGALKLKDEGIIDHICFSTHAPVEDIVKILKTKSFEAVTISYSLLNSLRYVEVLETAQELNIGVAAMNPLGGGIIPNNAEYFSFALNNEDPSISSAALRYVLAHRNVQIALAGVSTLMELKQNLNAVNLQTTETYDERITRVNSHIKKLDNFCTGCNYCQNCPAGIPISAIMQCRNSLSIKPANPIYDKVEDEFVRQNIYVVGKLEQEYAILFETAENPCILCGRCERKCTQRLKIMEGVADTYRRAKYSECSRQARIEKLKALIDNTPENTIGIYPSGLTSLALIKFYRENIGDLNCKIVLFDSNPAVWGKSDHDMVICPPNDIPKIKPSMVLITSYNYRDEIYEGIKHYKDEGINIVKLQGDKEIPWLL